MKQTSSVKKVEPVNHQPTSSRQNQATGRLNSGRKVEVPILSHTAFPTENDLYILYIHTDAMLTLLS